MRARSFPLSDLQRARIVLFLACVTPLGSGNDVWNGSAGRDRMLGGQGRDPCRASGRNVRRSCS
jgi:hypothetical protein